MNKSAPFETEALLARTHTGRLPQSVFVQRVYDVRRVLSGAEGARIRLWSSKCLDQTNPLAANVDRYLGTYIFHGSVRSVQ